MKVYIDNVEYELSNVQVDAIKKYIVNIISQNPSRKLAKCIVNKSFDLQDLMEENYNRVPCDEYKFDVKIELDDFSLIGCFPIEADVDNFKLSIDYIT